MIFPALVAIALAQTAKPVNLYTKSLTNQDGTIEMQTRAQRLVAPGKPDVWLIGAVHIGSKEYYSKIQILLNSQAAVLFEGVKVSGDANPFVKPAKDQKSIYKVLGDAIGLDFQLNDIDYDHPNWLDSDLTWSQINDLNSKASKGKPNQVDTIKKLMDPNSQAVKMFTTAIQSSTPGTREAFKIMMVKTVASGAGPGLDPTTSSIVVDARNKSVLTHFKTLIEGPNAPKSVGIFYGALHLPGIQRDLAAAYGYKPVDQQWFTSATANPKKVDATGQAILNYFQKMSKSGYSNLPIPNL